MHCKVPWPKGSGARRRSYVVVVVDPPTRYPAIRYPPHSRRAPSAVCVQRLA